MKTLASISYSISILKHRIAMESFRQLNIHNQNVIKFGLFKILNIKIIKTEHNHKYFVVFFCLSFYSQLTPYDFIYFFCLFLFVEVSLLTLTFLTNEKFEFEFYIYSPISACLREIRKLSL
jgi:hypothetical protein